MSKAAGPPDLPVFLTAKGPKMPEVKWACVPKDLHGNVHGLLHHFEGMLSEKLCALEATTHLVQLKPNAKPVYSERTGLGRTAAKKMRSRSRKRETWASLIPAVPIGQSRWLSRRDQVAASATACTSAG